ncbi:ABC transporter ATP-binding protein [Acinetobacter sp. MD2]|uniref:ABC transporter ATP-binding protein n=1 Tax=Acinetobacter sp. MD2 TaxID=2600066 RepID=UPI002D1E67A8|nr:ABC transporter ATP-binding protein [Acinetobacter sp. MD2]MEB3766356.1 ABC transporter ATP-binding protein [Acinetobacter sp. MD2]
MRNLSLLDFITAPSFAPALKPAVPTLLLGTLAAVFSGISMLTGLWGIIRFIGHVSAYWVIFSLLFLMLAAVFTALSSWLVHSAEAGFSARLRRQVASHLMHLAATTRSKQSEQHLKRLLVDDISALHHMVAHLPAEVATFVVVPLLSIVLLLHWVGLAALWILLPGALASLYYLIVVPYVSKRDGAARMQVMLDIIAAADDYARGIRDYRIYGQQASALSAYRESAQNFTSRMVSWVAKVATLAALATALLQAGATFAIAYWVAHAYDNITLAAALFFSLAIVTPALRLGHGLDYVTAGRAAATRLSLFFKEPVLVSGDIQHIQNSADFEIIDATMCIDDQVLFESLNHQFQAGTITAITGPSGIGKTTLLRILAGLERLNQGAVRYANTDMSHWHEQLRHAQILFVPQGGDVLPTTVRENLTLALNETDDAQLKRALSKVQLNVSLDADASLLSGGEKQRMNMARAFLSSASIILLDEPTSALDQNNAAQLMQELQAFAKNQHKTIVMVTHDLALAATADQKIALEGVAGGNKA